MTEAFSPGPGLDGSGRCGYAQPGTFGHECGRPAVFVGIKPSIFAATGTFYAYRCAECREFTGEDNWGITSWESADPARHVNVWRK